MTATSLQERIGKKRPFESPEQESGLMILYVADRLGNKFGRLFRQYGLTNSQYNVLRILRGEGKPLPALEVAERMIQAVPAITGLVDRLEKLGHVARRRSEEDRRVVFIEITKSGRQVLGKIDQPLQELHRATLGHMTRKELSDLNGLLEKASSRLASD